MKTRATGYALFGSDAVAGCGSRWRIVWMVMRVAARLREVRHRLDRGQFTCHRAELTGPVSCGLIVVERVHRFSFFELSRSTLFVTVFHVTAKVLVVRLKVVPAEGQKTA